MKKFQIVFVSAVALCSSQLSAQTAEEAGAACSEAVRLIGEEDFAGALEEAKWCVESLQQIKQQGMLKVFPDLVSGYAGGELENQSAMGMTILQRSYTGEGGVVDVSLTTGVAGGGLAALAQLGMGMGGGTGNKLRVQKRTVLDMSNGGESQYMVQLKSGGMLTISSNDIDAEQLLVFVRAFPIELLDDALSQ